MRALVIALILATAAGCPSKGGGTKAPAAVAAVFPAARFVPAQPTYVLSARTMRDGQAAFTHVIDMLGMMVGFELSEAGRELSQMLGVDPLSADALAGIGIDLEGSMAVFSEDVNPTFVVHLTSADAMTGFLEGQRQRGLGTQSVIVGGTEVFTAKVDSDVHISWAVEKEWLWVHFAFGGSDGVEWFEHSKAPGDARWVDGWTWAQGLAASPSLSGVVDLQGLFAKLGTKAREAITCGKQFAAVKRVGVNVAIASPGSAGTRSGAGGGAESIGAKRFAGKVAFDLGPEVERVRGLLLQPPPGWSGASANAPIAAQWNADLPVATAWLEVCTQDDDIRVELEQLGVRSFRAFLHQLDPDDNEGVGAIAADLSSAQFFRQLLDRIPGRSMAESNRTFGVYKGKHISVPFVGKGDYVLTEQIAIGAMGKGVLERVGTGAPPSGSPPVFAVDVRPPGLSADVWAFLFEQLDAPEPKRLAQRLLLWTDLHLGAQLEGSALVIDAHGNRR